MILNKNLSIKGKYNKPIVTDLFFKKNKTQKPLIIFCHGYKGFKDWGVFGKMYTHFTSHGFALLTFNFSHNGGTKKDPIDFPDLLAFGNNNYSKELDDLKTIIDWVYYNKEYTAEIDVKNITLIGHSRGGAIATLTAATDKRIKQLITWASVCTLDRSFFHGKELEKWKKDGVIFIENARTKQQMPHYIQFYEDYQKHLSKFDIEKAAKKIKIPHLIIHGTKDLSVPLLHAKNLHTWSLNSELCKISNANHVFGAKQPWIEEKFPKDFKLVLEKTIEFLKNNC